MVYCDYANRRTITEDDIIFACKKIGISLFNWFFLIYNKINEEINLNS